MLGCGPRVRPPLLCRGEEQALLGDHEDHPREEGSQAEDGHHGHLRRPRPRTGDPQHHRGLTSRPDPRGNRSISFLSRYLSVGFSKILVFDNFDIDVKRCCAILYLVKPKALVKAMHINVKNVKH